MRQHTSNCSAFCAACIEHLVNIAESVMTLKVELIYLNIHKMYIILNL